MKIRSLNHIGLTVSNFDKSVKWYNEMFGFKLIAIDQMAEERVMKLNNLYNIDSGGLKLGFLRAPKAGLIELFEFENKHFKENTKWDVIGPTHITLDVKNVPKWYDKLKKKGVEFFFEVQKTGNVEWVFLKDPDGNVIELIDMKSNYLLIRWLGGVVGSIFKKTQFKDIYKD